MPEAPPPLPTRAFDGQALAQALRRLARSAEPPWLHAEVARRMQERLAIVKRRPGVIIDWWGYTGAGAARLAETYPHARRIVVEPSAALAARSDAAARAPWWTARHWARRNDAVRLEADDLAPGGAHLLWSNMMLHAVADPPALLARWQRALAVDGFAMFSCLGPGSLPELHALYRKRAWGEPGAAFVDMHDLGDMLVAAGFADPVMDQETLTLTWSSPQALLAELRGLGANASPQRWPGLRTPRWRDRLLEALRALAGADGRLRLGFEIVYGHAFKAAPRIAASGEASFSVDQMRERLREARGRPG